MFENIENIKKNYFLSNFERIVSSYGKNKYSYDT